MHNGQVGGFEAFRKRADMLVPDHLYGFRKGATDSEVLFLLALAEGLEENAPGALARAAGKLAALSRDHGEGPHLRLSAAFSDGQALWAARGSCDSISPTVYYRWSETRKGWAVVSEPLEMGEADWTPLCPGKIARFEGDQMALYDLPL